MCVCTRASPFNSFLVFTKDHWQEHVLTCSKTYKHIGFQCIFFCFVCATLVVALAGSVGAVDKVFVLYSTELLLL